MSRLLMRQSFFLLIKAGVSLGLLYLALGKVDFAELWSRIHGGSAAWLLLAVIVTFLQILVAALRWQSISAECGVPLTLWQASRFNLIGLFFNQVLPSSIGGDAMRLWLAKNTSASWRNAAYSVFLDRAIGLIALAILIVASLPWTYELIQSYQGRIALVAIDLIALAGAIGFLLLGKLPFEFLKHWWLTHHPFNCSVIAQRLLFGGKNSVRIIVLSIMIHLLTATTAWCVARSIQVPVAAYQIFLLVPPVILITMLPIAIAGWGVRETAMMVAFGYAALPQQDGINLSLLFGGVALAIGLMGGIAWILSPEKPAKSQAKETDIAIPR